MSLKPSIALFSICAAALAGCTAESGGEPETALRAADVSQPEGWADDLALPEAVDINPDPRVVEIELEARLADIEFLPGKPTTVWTYNGLVPGPLIRANLGDRVIVHFKNSLPEQTTIHWHGVRVPNDMDGAPGMTQPPVPSGGEFRYEFVMRDAGTYWYHPHMNSSEQVGRGLYGPIVVNDPAEPEAFGDELVLVLSDMGIRENGELVPLDTGGSFGDLFGREGSVVLVNGKVSPRLKLRSGKQQRWRIINAARSRYFDLRLREHDFVRIGGDSGLAAESTRVDHVLVTPGERADLVFTPSDAPGTERIMYWLPPDRGYGTQTGRGRDPLIVLETVDLPPVEPAAIPSTLRTIPAIDVSDALEKTLALTIEISSGGVSMGINGVPYERSKPLLATIGETHVWHVVNDTDFAHPFHLHGYFFQVLGAVVPEWKDTVNVPAHSSLDLAVVFDERPGMWMYHCHILDHAEVGMMGHLHVVEPDEADEHADHAAALPSD